MKKQNQPYCLQKKEFEAKAKSFEEEGMSDIAIEFHQRANKINKLFK